MASASLSQCCFALKPEPIKILKGLLCNPFKIFIVVRLLRNCCKAVAKPQRDAARRAASLWGFVY